MTTQATKLITAEELFEMGDIGRCELIDGEIVRMSPSGAEHGNVAMNLGAILRQFVKAQGLGRVFAAETGFKLAPRRVRAPDVAFVRAERLAAGIPKKFFDGPPDLAVEVVSPSDAWHEVEAKVEDWLARGARSCWVVDPKTRLVVVYHPDGRGARLDQGGIITDEEILPGFSVPVAEVFDA
jgi:Uma2 family endonuclease